MVLHAMMMSSKRPRLGADTVGEERTPAARGRPQGRRTWDQDLDDVSGFGAQGGGVGGASNDVRTPGSDEYMRFTQDKWVHSTKKTAAALGYERGPRGDQQTRLKFHM